MINEIIEIEIKELNINLEGVGSYNGKKVCVKGVLPNEIIKAKIIIEKENFIFAKLIDIVKQNPCRIKPVCKNYYLCGGCDFSFVEPVLALEMKRKIIGEYFYDFYKEKVIVNKSNKNFYYRNKVVFSVKDNSIVGLKKEQSKEVVEIDNCLIVSEKINSILDNLKRILKNIKFKSNITHFVIREIENKFILTIVVEKLIDTDKNFEKVKDNLIKEFGSENFGLYINENNNKKEIFGKTWHYIFGVKNLEFEIFDLTAKIHPYSFLQVNNFIMEKLYLRVLDFILESQSVIEGYSGAGILSGIISKKAERVFSVEENINAFLNAEDLKKTNGLQNLTNKNGLCEEIIPNLKIENKNTVFVVDPPQSGCDKKMLDSIIKNKISKIIYVSCNPYTLKQNIGYLKKFYSVKHIEIFDMFPNTSHIETLCVLQSKD